MTSKTSIDFNNTTIAFASKSTTQLKKAYLIFSMMNYPQIVNIGSKLINLSLKWHLPIEWIIKRTLFEQFCGGETIEACQYTIKQLMQANINTILNYAVESKQTEVDFDTACKEIEKTIISASRRTNETPFAVLKISSIGSLYLLEKFQHSPNSLNAEELSRFENIKKRVLHLCQQGYTNGVKILFDAEESWIQNVIDTIGLEMMKKYNTMNQTWIYITYQMYRKNSLAYIYNHHQLAKNQHFRIGAKLVRGAYLEQEHIYAQQKGCSNPIFNNKIETDHAFNEAIQYLLAHLDCFSVCIATHNEESCRLSIEIMQKLNINPQDTRVLFAQLLGMSNQLSYNLAQAGYHVAKYVPYGPIRNAIPYLLRRAQENKSIQGQSSREYLLLKKELERRKRTQN